MAQDYEVLDFKKGTFQDNFGNYWCSMSLKGVGEPVSIAVKDPTQFEAGMTLYGSIETKESRAGKDYLKFKREKKEEVASTGEPAKASWQPRDDDRIVAQWAIGQANAYVCSEKFRVEDHDPIEDIESIAKDFYAMVERVKSPNKEIDVSDGEPISLNDIPF